MNGERKVENDAGDRELVNTFDRHGYLLPGEDLIIECYVNDAVLGAYMDWWKQQKDGRKVKLGRDSTLESPFSALGRYQVRSQTI